MVYIWLGFFIRLNTMEKVKKMGEIIDSWIGLDKSRSFCIQCLGDGGEVKTKYSNPGQIKI